VPSPIFERMLNVFDLHLSAPEKKAVSRICASKPRRNLQTFGRCLTTQTVIPVGFCYLTSVCENKQGNQYNGANLLRKFVSEKVSIIDPL
jgi:hypothetical protein